MIRQSEETQFAVHVAKAAGRILMKGFGTGMRVDHKSGEIDLVTEFDRRADEYILGRIQKTFPGHRILSEESGRTPASPASRGQARGQARGKARRQAGTGDDPQWMVDPLDGTTNFAHGIPIFAVSIALREAGQTRLGVVYDPTRKDCFWAERGKGAYLGERRLRVSAAAELRASLLVTGFPYDAWSNPDNNLDNYARFAVRSQGVRRLGSAALDLAYIAAGWFDGYWELRLSPWDVAAGGLIAEEAGARVTAMDGQSPYLNDPPSLIAANPLLHAKMMAVIKGQF